MKKRNLMVALLCSMCLAVSTPMPAMADATKVVTLGADLTQDQKNTMMNYFKADANQVQIVTVTNTDEHNYLGKYVPSEQIGTRTLSCAYVKPTQSGGIKVRTANLNYVTCNMIATALSTAGVTNCEAVAACPFEVSGTGALTGVMMAYEAASGSQLDSTKKDLATQEVVVTGNIGQQVGQDNATNIINQAKMQIIGDNIQNADEIYNIVNNIAVQNGVDLSSDELNTIVSLLQQIVQQNYDIQDMKKTLENIQQNLEQSKAEAEGQPTPTPIPSDDSSSGDDITSTVDSSALGGDIKETSTEDPGLAEETGAGTNDAAGDSNTYTEDATGIPEATEDGSVETTPEDNGESTDGTDQNVENTDQNVENTDQNVENTDQNIENTDQNTDGTEQNGEGTDEGGDQSGETAEDPLNTDSLSDEDKAKFDQAKQFCTGEYQGDLATLQSVMPEVTDITVSLDGEQGTKLTQKVLEAYINILKDGGVSYVPADTDIYMSAQMNMINTDMKKIFSIENDPAEDDILVDKSLEDRTTLYNDTMKFFETLYNETSTQVASEETAEGAGDAENTESAETTEEYSEESADGMENAATEEATY